MTAGYKVSFGDAENIPNNITVMIELHCKYIKDHWILKTTEHFKQMNLLICKLYLMKLL